jgi:hypothetical protein
MRYTRWSLPGTKYAAGRAKERDESSERVLTGTGAASTMGLY